MKIDFYVSSLSDGKLYAYDQTAAQWYLLDTGGGFTKTTTNPLPDPAPVPPVVVPPVTSLWVLGPGSTKTILDTKNNAWQIGVAGDIRMNGVLAAPGSSGLTLYQGVVYRQDTQNKTWWTISGTGPIGGWTIVQSGTDPTKVTPAPTWDPPVIVPPVIVVPPIVVPPVVTPPVTPGGNVVVLPKITAHYPIAAHAIPQGQSIQAALDVFKICRTLPGAYSGDIIMQSGYQLYVHPLTLYTGTIDLPDKTTGCVLSGLGSPNGGPTVNANGHVKGNIIRRLKYTQTNAQSGLFDSNLMYAFRDSGFNVIAADGRSPGADWTDCRMLAQAKHSSPTGVPDTLIKSPKGAAARGNVFGWRTYQSLDWGMDISNQNELTVLGTDVEGGTKMLTSDTGGVLRASVLNGVGQGSGMSLGMDELQLMGGGIQFGGPTVLSSGLKRLFTAGVSPLTTQGSIGTIANENSAAGILLPFLAPQNRLGSPWERAVASAPAGGAAFPAIIPGALPAGAVDSTAALAAAIKRDGITLWPAGFYYLTDAIMLGDGQGVIGAGDGKTIFVLWNSVKDGFRANVGGSVVDNGTRTGAVTLTDLTIVGGFNQLHFDNPGDQLSECLISHVTFANAGNAGICAEMIYGVDNNFITQCNFVGCKTGFLQKPDPRWPALPPGQNGVDRIGKETNTMTYVDKTVFLFCQFINCGKGCDMQAARQNNLDAWIFCIFKSCGSVGTFSGTAALLFVRCDFLDCTAPLQSQVVYLFGCLSKQIGPHFMGDVVAEGHIFQGSGPAFTQPGNILLANVQPGGMTLAGKQLNCNDATQGQYCWGGQFA